MPPKSHGPTSPSPSPGSGTGGGGGDPYGLGNSPQGYSYDAGEARARKAGDLEARFAALSQRAKTPTDLGGFGPLGAGAMGGKI
uniref:hypothetical protein n=1 Tax=Umezawaea beigongshangensis TaxID=2780383 RepID=UPI0018F12E5F